MISRMTVLGGLLALIVFADIVSVQRHSDQTRVFHQKAIDAYRIATELEREIGFGGLIHNFKNAVLRPDETSYLAAAERNQEEAVRLVHALEAAARAASVSFALDDVRAMIDAYGARLARVREHGQNGWSARAIDLAVRYDDSAALDEIEAAVASIDQQINRQIDELDRGEMIRNGIGFSAGAAVILWLASLGVRAARDESLRRVQAANQELEQANKRLNRANAALKQYAGIAAHDLKSPARKMEMFARQIHANPGDAAAVKRFSDIILRGAEKMSKLVESLLDFSQQGFRPTRREPIDMTDLAQEIADELLRERCEDDATVDVDLLPDIVADRELIARALHNLLDNSLKYARVDEPAAIRVSGWTEGDECVFAVEDNGIGVETGYADQIFEPLQRLHSDSSGYPGVGIGLSLVRSIVEAHGGRVWLDSSYSTGARFLISVPQTRSRIARLAA